MNNLIYRVTEECVGEDMDETGQCEYDDGNLVDFERLFFSRDTYNTQMIQLVLAAI